jgi:hypothetical protein
MLTDAQLRWQRNYYRKVRRFNKRWLANCEAKRQERKAVADPNIEREYHQERNFRFGLTFTRNRSYDTLPVRTVAQLSNPRWKFVLNGRVREEVWSALQMMPRLGREKIPR